MPWHVFSRHSFVGGGALAPSSARPVASVEAGSVRSSRLATADATTQAGFTVGVGALACGLAAASLNRRRAGVQAHRGRGSVVRLFAEGAAMKRKKEVVDPDMEPGEEGEELDWSKVSDEWELDCFSRPVLWDGKKMWELLICDNNAMYRRVAQMKPTRVNSVVVQKIIAIFLEESKVKPKVIRFYRKVMKNMLTVAMNSIVEEKEMDLKILPSRNCHMLRRWISYRERVVYPKMEGFLPAPPKRPSPVQAQMVQMAFEKLPEKLKFPRYAFSCIPYGSIAAMKPGTLPGNMCKVPVMLGKDTLIHGVILLSTRADVVCQTLKTLELCNCRVNLETNELLMELGIDQTYKVAKVPIEDKESCLEFERSKRALGGLHFVVVHNPFDGGEMTMPNEDGDASAEGCISGLWLCMDYTNEDA